MEKTYEKVDELTLKVITTHDPEVVEQNFDLAFLKSEIINLEDQIAELNLQLDEVNALISKAAELGVKDKK